MSERIAVVVVPQEGQRRWLCRRVAGQAQRRQRIASDLHDHVGQVLATVKIQLQGVLQDSSLAKTHATALAAAKDSCSEVMRWARRTMSEVGPPHPERGIEAAASWLVDRLAERDAIEAVFDDDHRPKPLPGEQRMVLVEALGAVLDNVALHAKARRVRVSLRVEAGQLLVVVEDDGQGFVPAELGRDASALSLLAVASQLALYDGRLEVESAPGAGTRVVLQVPLKSAGPGQPQRGDR